MLSGLTSTYSSIESLQSQIDNNNSLIRYIEAQLNSIREVLTAKQNIINGVCPSGYSMTRVFETGGVQCELVGSGAAGFIRYAEARAYLVGGSQAFVDVVCAPGWTVAGGGYMSQPFYTVFGSYPLNSRSWRISMVSVYAGETINISAIAVASCVKYEPPSM